MMIILVYTMYNKDFNTNVENTLTPSTDDDKICLQLLSLLMSMIVTNT
jgi:hypothetical protein